MAVLQLAPITVLEFAEMAADSGGLQVYPKFPFRVSHEPPVPSGVLSVLPGYGAIVGKEIVSNPLIRKVDITVSEKKPIWTVVYL